MTEIKMARVQLSGITKKYHFLTDDGYNIKVAYVNRPEKIIVCQSTQIGCSGLCRFCSAGNLPLVRNLTADEMCWMIEESYRLSNLVSNNASKPVLVSFMGTGEPLANGGEVCHVMSRLPFSRFALSTSGYNLTAITPYHALKVQFTLVSADWRMRKYMQPHVDPLPQLRNAIRRYPYSKEINVPLIANVNDNERSMEEIAELSRMVGGVNIKLNRYHPMRGYRSSDYSARCLDWLLERGCPAEYYETDGEDILAACGQFELPDNVAEVK